MAYQVIIYTDGAASGNPGPGGLGVVLKAGTLRKELAFGFRRTTNNRMEIYAVIAGLEQLKQPCEVTVYSDSAYVCNAVENGWLAEWMNNGWRTAGKKDVKNVDLWQELICLMGEHNVSFVKVKGHADNEYNNACDKAARAEIDKFRRLPQ